MGEKTAGSSDLNWQRFFTNQIGANKEESNKIKLVNGSKNIFSDGSSKLPISTTIKQASQEACL